MSDQGNWWRQWAERLHRGHIGLADYETAALSDEQLAKDIEETLEEGWARLNNSIEKSDIERTARSGELSDAVRNFLSDIQYQAYGALLLSHIYMFIEGYGRAVEKSDITEALVEEMRREETDLIQAVAALLKKREGERNGG